MWIKIQFEEMYILRALEGHKQDDLLLIMKKKNGMKSKIKYKKNRDK